MCRADAWCANGVLSATGSQLQTLSMCPELSPSEASFGDVLTKLTSLHRIKLHDVSCDLLSGRQFGQLKVRGQSFAAVQHAILLFLLSLKKVDQSETIV